MTEFTAKLADIPIAIAAQYSETKTFLRDYLCEEPPAFGVRIRPEDIEFEQEKSVQEAQRSGERPVRYSPAYLETLAVYRQIAEQLLDHEVLLFHGSAIAVDGQVYIFTAKSGTGKSTHVRLWREYLGERAVMVNDDKPLLKITEQGITVYGTPWDGKHHLSNPIALPLKALVILKRDSHNHIGPVKAEDAFPALLTQSYRPENPMRMIRLLSMLDCLGRQAELYELGCNMEPEAAKVAYEGMQAKE